VRSDLMGGWCLIPPKADWAEALLMMEEMSRASDHTLSSWSLYLADRGLHYLGGVYDRKKVEEKD